MTQAQRQAAGVPNRLDVRSIDGELAESVLWALKRSTGQSEARISRHLAQSSLHLDSSEPAAFSSFSITTTSTSSIASSAAAGAHPALQQGPGRARGRDAVDGAARQGRCRAVRGVARRCRPSRLRPLQRGDRLPRLPRRRRRRHPRMEGRVLAARRPRGGQAVRRGEDPQGFRRADHALRQHLREAAARARRPRAQEGGEPRHPALRPLSRRQARGGRRAGGGGAARGGRRLGAAAALSRRGGALFARAALGLTLGVGAARAARRAAHAHQGAVRHRALCRGRLVHLGRRRLLLVPPAARTACLQGRCRRARRAAVPLRERHLQAEAHSGRRRRRRRANCRGARRGRRAFGARGLRDRQPRRARAARHAARALPARAAARLHLVRRRHVAPRRARRRRRARARALRHLRRGRRLRHGVRRRARRQRGGGRGGGRRGGARRAAGAARGRHGGGGRAARRALRLELPRARGGRAARHRLRLRQVGPRLRSRGALQRRRLALGRLGGCPRLLPALTRRLRAGLQWQGAADAAAQRRMAAGRPERRPHSPRTPPHQAARRPTTTSPAAGGSSQARTSCARPPRTPRACS